MPGDTDINKIKDFVDHLLNLPNIKNEPFLIGEGLILNFIVQNTPQLKITFKTPQFFPKLDWNDVLQILLSELYNRIVADILPVFEDFIDNADLTIMNKLQDAGNIPLDFHREKLKGFLNIIIRNKDVRYNMNSVYNIFQYDIVEKYIAEIFRRRDSIYNEIVRVSRIYLEADEYVTFIKIMLILKNAAHMKIPFSGGGAGNKVNLTDFLKMPGKPGKFITSMAGSFKEHLPNIPVHIIELALKSNLKASLTEMEDACSRFIYILSSRYHTYKPVENIDRGAESPDKSWFSIARKNAEFHGFDKRIIDGLYRIAGDNNW